MRTGLSDAVSTGICSPLSDCSGEEVLSVYVAPDLNGDIYSSEGICRALNWQPSEYPGPSDGSSARHSGRSVLTKCARPCRIS